MMSNTSTRAQIGTLIIATGFIQIGNGFFNTFISLRVAIEDFEATTAGLVLSSYFVGFTIGALRCGKIIARIGHIRAYAAFAGLAVAATATMPLLVGPLPWLIQRAVIGFGCSGLFVTAESWLNARALPAERGRIFSIYMVGTFVALALGQLLIARVNVTTAGPFSMIAALFSLALVMVSMTRAEAPRTATAPSLPYQQLLRAAPIAVAGCALSGLITGTFYALVPAWMQGEEIPQSTIGFFMLVAVLGGLIFQVPVGRCSDRFDRLSVLAVLGLGFAFTAVALIHLPNHPAIELPAAVLLGGFMSCLYPVCIANAHDHMPADRVLAVSGRLILTNGVGAALGPILGMSLMRRFDIDGVFYLMAAAASLIALLAVGRSLTSPAPPHLERPFDILTPQAAPVAHDPIGAADGPARPAEAAPMEPVPHDVAEQ
ncbi:MFS transporter [Dongia soli]|uniref:MFS transporter n=1 Tax=Dongia soli TaxID=600628 RepID=A0ABU5EH79_9PROT|nr:MFS transporter [Dongia soli]MDY0885721.1 MFS transporter [Dongia soli]